MTSNYDLQQEMARQQFAREDMGAIARRFGLEADGEHLYIPFFHRLHRISRTTAAVEAESAGGWTQADFHAHLSLYDALSRPGTAQLSHQWSTVNHLGNMHHPGVDDGSLYAPYLSFFDRHRDSLEPACLAMGGRPFPVGEVAFQLEAMPFLPMVFQFWAGDEEFPPQIRLLWDFNTLDFVHYETTWYIAHHGLDRIRDLVVEHDGAV